MNRRQITFFFAIAVIATVLASCGAGQPDIELGTNAYDFGDVPQFDVVTVDIPLRNIGNGVLRIESVSTSCGCTSANIDQTRIEAGGEAMLTVTYDSGLHPDSGSIYRVVFLKTNDPNQPEYELEVVANVIPAQEG